jgi:hypothetical protein
MQSPTTLGDLPIETLTQIMLNLSYENLNTYCTVNSVAKSICNDPNFWANKAGLEFKIPIPDFYSVQMNPRLRYLQLRETAGQRNLIYNFLINVLALGLYIRGWQGPGTSYPLIRTTSQCSFNEPKSLITIYNIYNVLNNAQLNIKQILLKVSAMRYDNNTNSYIPTGKMLTNILDEISSGKGCSRLYSDVLIATAVYYLNDLFGVIPLDITQLQRAI